MVRQQRFPWSTHGCAAFPHPLRCFPSLVTGAFFSLIILSLIIFLFYLALSLSLSFYAFYPLSSPSFPATDRYLVN